MSFVPDNPPSINILLVGCGKMGGAMLERWVKRGLFQRCVVVDPHMSLGAMQNVSKVSDISQVPKDFVPNVIVFAVKPQAMDETVPLYKTYPSALFISIAAGKPIHYFQEQLGNDAKIVRAMPNTPAAIGKGVTVACANRHVSLVEKEWAQHILSAVGVLTWVTEESLLNAVTALSGSGPAYVFLLIETLTEAGTKAGLKEDMARTLARQTVIGSAALAEASPDQQAADLRNAVTSPGGTTEAALKILMDGRLQDIYNEALNAAKLRAEELAK